MSYQSVKTPRPSVRPTTGLGPVQAASSSELTSAPIGSSAVRKCLATSVGVKSRSAAASSTAVRLPGTPRYHVLGESDDVTRYVAHFESLTSRRRVPGAIVERFEQLGELDVLVERALGDFGAG